MAARDTITRIVKEATRTGNAPGSSRPSARLAPPPAPDGNAIGPRPIAEAVRRQAEDPSVCGPAPPPELNMELVLTPRYALLLTDVPSWNLVQRLRLGVDDLIPAVREVRAAVRARGRTRATWFVGHSSPPDLTRRLLELGMRPNREPPFEPHLSCMALVRTPEIGALPHIVVERAETLEALATAEAIAAQAFGIRADDQRSIQTNLETRLRLQREGRAWLWQYLATIDGVPVGTARARPLAAGVHLAGAGVLPSARGRGVYHALIAARWQDAIARGTPALTVQAGAMSRPILQRLGFITVAATTVVCDRFKTSMTRAAAQTKSPDNTTRNDRTR